MSKLTQSLLFPPHLTGDAIVHRKTYEQTALGKFSELSGKKVTKCGLFVDVAHPFLGASPDGIVDDGAALVEVKCPYKERQEKIKAGEPFPYLEMRDGELRLKRNSNYYFQVQGQMKICGRSLCYFVVNTHKDVVIEKVLFDSKFYDEKMAKQLHDFYHSHYLPRIVSTL